MNALIWLAILLGLIIGLTVLGFRWTRAPRMSTDLRRADEAESTMPTADEVRERIGEAFGQTRPSGP